MDTRQETWRVEEGMVCADPSPNDKPPYGDLVALEPSHAGVATDPAFELSAALWPERAERLVAAHNAFVGHAAEDFAQLVEDALVFRWLADTDPQAQHSVESLRELYRNRDPEETKET